MYFDTHAHYDDARFDADRDALLASMPQSGVSCILNPGCTVASSRAALDLARRFPFVYAAVGLHPEECHGAGEAELAAIRALGAEDKVVAIGEIGLDYHWDTNPPREQQQFILRRQLALAVELDKPVIVHDRDAHADCFAIVSEFPGLRGVFHCYSGSVELARELWKRGWYVGFDGPLTYKNARKTVEVAAEAQPDRILIETDSPYLSPVPLRGTRNDSRSLVHVAAKLAEIRGMTTEEVIGLTAENGKRLFGIGSERPANQKYR